VLEEWVALDLLTSLADQSLVAAETSGASVRYRLLETIRQYARERLIERNEEQDAQDRHLIHFMTLVEEAEQHLSASEQQMWLERLETEHDNLRAALRWALSDESHSAAALRLCGAAARFWQIRGHFREGRHWCDAALASPGGGERNANRANALAGGGLLAFWQGDPSAAETLYEESLSIRREIGDRASIAASLADLGTVEELKGRFESARKLFEESLSIRRDLDDRRGIAATLNYLAKTEAFVGTKLRAKELMEESLAMSRELNDMSEVARTLRALGTLLLDQEDPSAVRAALNESLDIQERLGDKWGTGYSLAILGIVGLDEGDTGIARAHFAQATSIFSELRDNWGVALVLQQWASLAVAEAEAIRAARLYGSAERLFEDVGSTMLLVLRGRYERGVANARAALAGASIYQAAFLEGRSFTTEQAIEYALTK
jgi:tetratricopeptide (TPR) repeat protein